MKKYILFSLFSCVIVIHSFAQNALNLESFLGYKVGTKFTRHHQILDYFKLVAAAYPKNMKLEKYGTTNEGRELTLAFISSPENIENLETIQSNNLTYAGLNNAVKKAPFLAKPAAIVWLSYNVHGNEPSSSEAALLTLEELVVKNIANTQDWLKNVVVIIDPCINPDGRDRYVNWYNNAVGTNLNADPQAREHNEPWPQGRTNHYNFDLNRDWAWQTQVESKARIKKYLQWMPQVHVDFHEQGYNEPYYFAPAAEPFHEVITKWQRDFQTTIGKNHAKYFDKNGWLYFTKERFDLFYPSYGDTYPTFNGSIGMTYEQGGIRAGLGIKNSEGDTLTLVDRAMHHFTTSLSTIEISSKNATSLVDEFSKYFANNMAAKSSIYKTYILSSDDENKLLSATNLLEANGIQYYKIDGKMMGYNYATSKDENIVLKEFSVAINVDQPRGSMATVLLEPKSKLSDSATYDITAWSMAFVYGLDGYALKESKQPTISKTASKTYTSLNADYGFVLPYTSLNGAKALAYLLKNNVKVRFASKHFTYNKINFNTGSLIVLKTSNALVNWNKLVNEAAQQFNILPTVVTTGFMDKGADFGSPDVRIITAPKVALFTGEQVGSSDAGEVWNYFDHTIQYPITQLLTENLARHNLKNYDVIIMPDGYYRNLNDKNITDKIKDFVKNGGRLIAIAGAVNTLSNGDWGIKNKIDKEDEKVKDDYSTLKKYGNRDREYLNENIPGAIYKVEMDNTHPLAYGYNSTYYTLKQDANIYEFMKDGWNVGVLKKDSYVTGFTGFKVKNKLKDGMLFGVHEMGNGQIVFLSDNPIFRQFWENGKLLLSNAIFMVGQ